MCNCLTLVKIGNWQLMCKGEALIHQANCSPQLFLPFGRWPARLGKPMAGMWRSNIWWCHGSNVIARGGNEVCWVKGGGGEWRDDTNTREENGGRRRAWGGRWWHNITNMGLLVIREPLAIVFRSKIKRLFFCVQGPITSWGARKIRFSPLPHPKTIKKKQSYLRIVNYMRYLTSQIHACTF